MCITANLHTSLSFHSTSALLPFILTVIGHPLSCQSDLFMHDCIHTSGQFSGCILLLYASLVNATSA